MGSKLPYEKPELVRFGELQDETGACGMGYDVIFADGGSSMALCCDGCQGGCPAQDWLSLG
jgi:hypothetical protein